ncbi:MAG: hypothetical protein E6J89_14530 [Deltaproteobacteria bacterium]|nr:MAG: hypothetical protein E6J89_14530 [Deltaproteobacteria bacterium]
MARWPAFYFPGREAHLRRRARSARNDRQASGQPASALVREHSFDLRLKRPQPSLMLMLASGYSPVYPAHIPPAELRTKCVGTGPFKLKEIRPGELIEYVKNTDYFLKGRPYLEGIRYTIIRDRNTRYSAIQAGRQDVPYPLEIAKTIAETVKQSAPKLVLTEHTTNVYDSFFVNWSRPIFSDLKLRNALNLAVDRKGYIKAARQSAAVSGGVMLPPPYGVWGLSAAEQAKMPGFGDPAKQRRLWSIQALEAHRLHAGHSFLRRDHELRRGSVEATRHRSDDRTDRNRRLACQDDAQRIRAGRGPNRHRAGRSGCQALRRFQMRLAA